MHAQSSPRTASKQEDTAGVVETAVGTLPLAAGQDRRCLHTRGSPSSQEWGFRAGASRASGSIKGTRGSATGRTPLPPRCAHSNGSKRWAQNHKAVVVERKVSRATAVLPAPATRRRPRGYRASPCQPHSQVGTAQGRS